MSEMPQTMATSVSPKRLSVQTPATKTSPLQCLVVSPDVHRANLLDRAAGEKGWDTIVVSDVDQAAREALRNRVRLAVVDLESVGLPDQATYREFVERLAAGGIDGPLLIVCGAEEDVSSEIWSREHGVWMYLPGVDDNSDVAMLCGEARGVVEKRLDVKPRVTK